MTLDDIYTYFSSPDKGGDKGTQHSYISIYGEQIPPSAKSILEIGVYKGQSLAMWQQYLIDATVIGLDVNVDQVTHSVDARLCDATDPTQVNKALGDHTFDYIIDDGSHKVHDQIASLKLLWDRVNPGGAYFIEDIAGPDALRVLLEYIDTMQVAYQTWDLRSVKNRFDDMLVMVRK
jgi:predicted O-methyltransferase YrrM